MTKMIRTLFLFFLSAAMLSGCTTIYFDNGDNTRSLRPETNWHHNYVFNLIEGSEPVKLNYKCRNRDWVSVKTELTFINALAGGLVNLLGPIWYPKTVEVYCGEIERAVSESPNSEGTDHRTPASPYAPSSPRPSSYPRMPSTIDLQ